MLFLYPSIECRLPSDSTAGDNRLDIGRQLMATCQIVATGEGNGDASSVVFLE